MGLGSTVHRGLSDASSSNYEPSHRSGSTSKGSTVRASTMTSATSMSKLIRSASTTLKNRESSSASVSSTVRPPTVATRTSRASTLRASTITTATSTSSIIRSASRASTLRPQKPAPTTSATNLRRSTSKLSYFSTTASRILWGRPPPGHSTLQPVQVATLTHTLSLPVDTPMLSSIIGALEVPISRSQFSHAPSNFCDAHFWFEKKYIDELTEVIAHEIGPQLDKLRIAPRELISKKTERLLSILQPYKDIFASVTDTSSILSARPTCPACTLSYFFQNADAVKALTICVKGRKHRNRPWPISMAWLEPCPGKGADWEAKWKTEGKTIGSDRNRVQRWRRENRLHEEAPEVTQVLGHQPGEGCDFCDALRMEQADEEELDAAIAEEEEGRAGGEEEGVYARTPDNDDESETTPFSDSETIRAMEEESIITTYLGSTAAVDSVYPLTRSHSVYDSSHGHLQQEKRKQALMGYLAQMGEKEDEAVKQERAKRASDWARSYQHLVGKAPASQTTLQFQKYPEPDLKGPELRAVEGWI